MKAAVIGTSRKENEKRVAIYPDHIKTLPEKIRSQLVFEKGYGIPFGMNDETIYSLTGNRPEIREDLIKKAPIVIIPKPIEEDFDEMRDGATVWGWIHSVQQSNVTQIAIDKKLTLVAWENMYYQSKRGRVHIFQKNNEMAGYCGVQHALQLRGIDGNFGKPRSAVVLGMGSVSRGAVYALKWHGFNNITVYTQRPSYLVSDKLPALHYRQMQRDQSGDFRTKDANGVSVPLIDELARADIIVNGVLQNPNDPVFFIDDNDISKFKKECLIIDISCDENMGFSFARPTNFAHPMERFGNILYYSVDHTPSLLWDSASCEISNSIIQYLPYIIEQKGNDVLDDAVDIREGTIINKDIISYQNRSPIYPYKIQEQEYQNIC